VQYRVKDHQATAIAKVLATNKNLEITSTKAKNLRQKLIESATSEQWSNTVVKQKVREALEPFLKKLSVQSKFANSVSQYIKTIEKLDPTGLEKSERQNLIEVLEAKLKLLREQ
jgi:hypothetical protein